MLKIYFANTGKKYCYVTELKRNHVGVIVWRVLSAKMLAAGTDKKAPDQIFAVFYLKFTYRPCRESQ